MSAALYFVGVARKGSTGEYRIDVPDLPGCGAVGVHMQQARRRAAEALAVYVERMAADGKAIPEPRSLAAIRDDRRHADAVTLVLVHVPAKFSRRDRPHGGDST